MGKAKRATRKELEEVVTTVIQEIQQLKQGFVALGNYVGAYVKYKGDTLTFDNFLQEEIDRAEKAMTEKPKEKDVTSDKRSRYKKVSTPPL
jgi:hypothetical protein